MRRILFTKSVVIPAMLIFGFQALAQESPAKPAASPKSVDHFAFGKTLFVKKEAVNQIAFDTIESDIEGWGRFQIVDSPQKADLIAEVSSDEPGGVRRNETTSYGPDGRPQSSMGTSREFSPTTVSLKISDAKSRLVLWSGTEHAKSAIKQKTQENNLVEAAQRLFEKFHDKVEPSAKE